jgi:hypothetical protein
MKLTFEDPWWIHAFAYSATVIALGLLGLLAWFKLRGPR